MTAEAQRRPSSPSPAAVSPDPEQLAVDNAAAWWSELAAARGHTLTRRDGYLSVVGSIRSGLRINLLRPDPPPAEVAELTELVRTWPAGSRITVEDPYSTVDLRELGLTAKRLPVMLRDPGPLVGRPSASSVQVTRAMDARLAATVERTVVESFPLEQFQPYQEGEALPATLLDRPGVAQFLADIDGAPAGACLTVNDGVVGGVYWVGTQPEHRSRGVGRAVMTAAIAHLDGLPVILTATAAGAPLYESMGFRTLADATWWYSPRPS